MKRVLCLLTAFQLTLCVFSQPLCNPLKYAMPQFSQGLINLDDGSRQSGVFNICIIDQGVYMISGKDTVITEANESIVKLSAGGHFFVKYQDKFIEAVDMADEVMLCLMRSTTIVDNVKEGAYGSVNATASIKSYSKNDALSLWTDAVLNDPANYRHDEIYVLAVGNKRYPFNQKSLLKCFPAKKDIINQYFSVSSVNPADKEAVLSLFSSLK